MTIGSTGSSPRYAPRLRSGPANQVSDNILLAIFALFQNPDSLPLGEHRLRSNVLKTDGPEKTAAPINHIEREWIPPFGRGIVEALALRTLCRCLSSPKSPAVPCYPDSLILVDPEIPERRLLARNHRRCFKRGRVSATKVVTALSCFAAFRALHPYWIITSLDSQRTPFGCSTVDCILIIPPGHQVTRRTQGAVCGN
jgi:hypothetical protein